MKCGFQVEGCEPGATANEAGHLSKVLVFHGRGLLDRLVELVEIDDKASLSSTPGDKPRMGEGVGAARDENTLTDVGGQLAFGPCQIGMVRAEVGAAERCAVELRIVDV
jgi:hypothetical protein